MEDSEELGTYFATALALLRQLVPVLLLSSCPMAFLPHYRRHDVAALMSPAAGCYLTPWQSRRV